LWDHCRYFLDYSIQISFHLNRLKPHCIQSSRVFVPAGTSKSTSRRHSIQAVTSVMAYVADAVTLSSTMRTGGIELGSSALMSSTLKWLHRIQCGFNTLSAQVSPRGPIFMGQKRTGNAGMAFAKKCPNGLAKIKPQALAFSWQGCFH
jgi:hypothetical protein